MLRMESRMLEMDNRIKEDGREILTSLTRDLE
jgi:hypothetical protein